MIWRDIPIPFELTTAEGKRMGEGRSAGVHLSDAINLMEKAKLGEDGSGKTYDNSNLMWAAFGFMFERWVDRALVEYYGFQRALKVSQQELLCDGVYLTPDAFNVDDGFYEEYKARWRSKAKWDGPDWERWFWKELVQVKANAHVLGTKHARLVIFFVCGDWKPPVPHPPVCREFEFSEQELLDNWRSVVAHARVIQKQREQGQQGQASSWPLSYNQAGEVVRRKEPL